MMSSGACSSGGMGGGSPPRYSGKVPSGQPSSKGKQPVKKSRPPQGFQEEIIAVIRFRLQEEAPFNEENMRWLLEPLEELLIPRVREEINFDHEIVQNFCHEALPIIEDYFPAHAVSERRMASRNICDANNLGEKQTILGDYLRKMRAGYRPAFNNLQRLLSLVSLMAIDIFHAMQRSAIVDLARAAVNFVIEEWRVGESTSADDDGDYIRRLYAYARYNELRHPQHGFELEEVPLPLPTTTPPIVVPSGLQTVTTRLYIPEPEFQPTSQPPINIGLGQASNTNPQPTEYYSSSLIVPKALIPCFGPAPGPKKPPSPPPGSDL